MSLEKRVARLEDRTAITELKHRYVYSIDRRQWEDFRGLFTEDCRLEFSRDGLDAYEGQDDLDKFVTSVESQRAFLAHMLHNPLIDIEGDRASGTWYFEAALTDHDGEAMWAQGQYDDVYERVDGQWKIHRIKTTYHYSTTYDGGWSNDVLVD